MVYRKNLSPDQMKCDFQAILIPVWIGDFACDFLLGESLISGSYKQKPCSQSSRTFHISVSVCFDCLLPFLEQLGTPMSHHTKSWLFGKDPDAGKDWKQEEKGITEDEMVGWHHQLKRHEFKQTPGDSEGQGSQYAAVHTAVGHDLATKQQGTGLLLEKLAQNHSVCVCCKSRHLFFCVAYWKDVPGKDKLTQSQTKSG